MITAHFLGVSPADLGQALLVHLRAIGNSALIVVDRRNGRAVRVDVVTGVLPKDRELTRLRDAVINRKRGASTNDHRRFFDRWRADRGLRSYRRRELPVRRPGVDGLG